MQFVVFSTPGVNTHNPPASSTIPTVFWSGGLSTWPPAVFTGGPDGRGKLGGREKPGCLLGRGAVGHHLEQRKRLSSLTVVSKLTLKQPFIFAAISASAPELPLAIFLSLLGGLQQQQQSFNSHIAHWRFSLLRNALPVATVHGSPAFKALLLDSCPHPVAFVSRSFFLFFSFNPSILVYLTLWAVKVGTGQTASLALLLA